jgi:hypothetical protein
MKLPLLSGKEVYASFELADALKNSNISVIKHQSGYVY